MITSVSTQLHNTGQLISSEMDMNSPDVRERRKNLSRRIILANNDNSS